MLRYVVSEQNPGIANWLETAGHPHGRDDAALAAARRATSPPTDGPTVEVVPFDDAAGPAAALRRAPDHRRGVRRPDRRPAGRRRPKDDLVTDATAATTGSPQLLQDKVVVLSGVGPGLGRALGEEAARMGADLVLASAAPSGGWRRWPRWSASHGRRALVVPTDITDEDACQRAGRRGARGVRPGRLPDQQRVRDPADGPAHHARPRRAAAPPTRPTCSRRCGCPRCSPTRWPRRNGLDHHAQLLRAVYSSQPEYAGYKLTKGALVHLASSLATELGPRGIRVNTRRAVATSTRTSTRPTSTGWPSSAASPTRTSTREGRPHRPQAAGHARGGRQRRAVPRLRPGLRGHRRRCSTSTAASSTTTER